MKAYSIRDYEPGDEGRIVELLELVFGVWPRFDLKCSPLEHWRWKYVDNPMGSMIVPIAVDGDLIVGLNPIFAVITSLVLKMESFSRLKFIGMALCIFSSILLVI